MQIVLEALGLLESFGSRLLASLVIGQDALVVPGGFRQFLGLVMHAGQQEASMRAKNRIRERSEHVERTPSRQIVLQEKTGIAMVREAQISVAASDPERIFDKESRYRLSLLRLGYPQKHICLITSSEGQPFEINRRFLGVGFHLGNTCGESAGGSCELTRRFFEMLLGGGAPLRRLA